MNQEIEAKAAEARKFIDVVKNNPLKIQAEIYVQLVLLNTQIAEGLKKELTGIAGIDRPYTDAEKWRIIAGLLIEDNRVR
jgi:hypothetical protein